MPRSRAARRSAEGRVRMTHCTCDFAGAAWEHEAIPPTIRTSPRSGTRLACHRQPPPHLLGEPADPGAGSAVRCLLDRIGERRRRRQRRRSGRVRRLLGADGVAALGVETTVGQAGLHSQALRRGYHVALLVRVRPALRLLPRWRHKWLTQDGTSVGVAHGQRVALVNGRGDGGSRRRGVRVLADRPAVPPRRRGPPSAVRHEGMTRKLD